MIESIHHNNNSFKRQVEDPTPTPVVAEPEAETSQAVPKTTPPAVIPAPAPSHVTQLS